MRLWRRTRTGAKPFIEHGIEYTLRHLRTTIQQSVGGIAPTPANVSAAQWLGTQLGQSGPLRLQRNAEDVRRLAANPAVLKDPAQLQGAALSQVILYNNQSN